MGVALKKNDPAREIRILLDARKLGDGGIGVYIENLISGLSAIDDVSLSIIVRSEHYARAWSNVSAIIDKAKPYSLDEMFWLSKRIDQSKFDIYHAPHFTLPFGIRIPSVITLHDLIHVYQPEKKFYPLISGALIRSAVKRATKVLTVSYSSFHDIARFIGKDSPHLRKISIIPNALSPVFLRKHCAEQQMNQKPYLFSVASNLKPHKGIRDLLVVFSKLKEKHADSLKDLRLLLVGLGTEHIFSNKEIAPLIAKDVECIGAVSQEKLFDLYAGAKALVVASLAEGFCLPLLEAQAVGIPVVARPVPAILEHVTPHDRVCKDFSLAALEREIESLLFEPHLYTSFDHRKEHIQNFTQKTMAEATFNVYREISDGATA